MLSFTFMRKTRSLGVFHWLNDNRHEWRRRQFLLRMGKKKEKKAALPWALLSFSKENANADFNYFNFLFRFDATEIRCRQGEKNRCPDRI